MNPSTARDLRIGGLARLSSCDWPDRLVATVFCRGCGWRCRYCHNPHLMSAVGPPEPAWDEVVAFLGTRKGLLDGVVFSGGEPLLQAALPAAMRAVRALGFGVGLHTAGPVPARLAAVLSLVDWIGFDVKAPFDRYERITGVPGSGHAARESLRRLLDSGIAYEVRTTVHPVLLGADDLADLADEFARIGVRNHRRQPFRPQGCLDATLCASA